MQETFEASDFPDLLVGLSGPDDAAVWRLDEGRALVATTDFFTPIVDDPYSFGAIAAANALSDVYAMGGTPFLALNISAFPQDLPVEICAEILRGGAEKAREAGVVIAGGHSVQDREPKYGLVALGWVDPRRMLRKSGLRPGDVLVLTKPLGFGLTTTALKREQADPADVEEAIHWMVGLNAAASRLALEFDLHAATDVTGFGLLGHALEMADASGVSLRLDFGKMPFLKGAAKYAARGAFAGGLVDNRSYFSPHVEFAASIGRNDQMMLFDPQTSGGLLLGVPPARIDDLLRRAAILEQPAWRIGTVAEGRGLRVE